MIPNLISPLDMADVIAAAGDHGKKKKKKRRWIQAFRANTYLKGTFLEFTVTATDFDDMIAEHAEQVAAGEHRIPLDYDHASGRRGKDGEAAGWVLASKGALEKRNDNTELWAQVEFTDEALEAIEAKKWRYISPEFTLRREEPEQAVQKASLRAIALTNRPLMADMNSIQANQSFVTVPVDQPKQQTDNPSSSTPSKEDTMDDKQIADAISAAVKAEMGGVTDIITASIAESVKETVTASVTEKVNEALSQNNAHLAQDALVTATLQKHVDRGAITANEFATEKALVMGANDSDKMLKDRDTFLGKLPDGDNPNSTVQGTGTGGDGALKANMQAFLDGQINDDVPYDKAIQATMAKFGADNWDDFSWSDQVQGSPEDDND